MHRFAWISLAALACSGPGEATDAGADVIYGHKSFDAGVYEAEAAAKTPLDRLTLHGGQVLAGAHVRVVYLGTEGQDASPSFDAYLSWLVTSQDYWGALLEQYGVGYEIVDGSLYMDKDTFFPSGSIQNGLVSWTIVEERLRELVAAGSADAGADASDDAGEGGAPAAGLPRADAYVLFLPYGVNVDLGDGTTCGNAGGYHSFDGVEPYSVIPPCGREGLAISHELAEMATDPVPGAGWYSDADLNNAGGEIGDICNSLTSVDGEPVTQLWSNKDGDCEPQ